MGRWFKAILARALAPLVAGLALAVVTPGQPALAENNGAALKPQMGWSSWSFIRHNPTEADIEAQALAMHSSGLQAHGYQFVNVDDFWYQCPNTVDSFGRWAVDTSKFPNGIDAVATYVHSLGLKFGIYVTPGIPFEAVTLNTPIEGTPYHAQDIANTSVIEKNYNCHQMYGIDYSKPGSQEFINSWANEFASWGVDYLKLDGVGTWDIPDLQAWSKALVSSGRLIHLELSNSLAFTSVTTWQQYANGWRIEGDIECYCNSTGGSYPLTSWSRVARRFSDDPKWAPFAGPGGWNDLDSLELGNGSNDGLTPDQRQTHMTLWALAAAPLILGSDLTNLDPFDLTMMTNDEVLAVDQAGIAASPLVAGATQQVWRARQPDGSYYVGLFNLDTVNSASVSVTWSQLGFSGPAAVRDLWSHTDLGTFSSGFGATLNPTASRLLKVVPSSKGFSLSATPGSRTVTAGGSTSYSVTVSPFGGFSDTVNLSVSGLPAGVACSFNPASISGGSGSSTMSCTTSSTSAGTSTLAITGTDASGSPSVTTTVSLTVKGPLPAGWSDADIGSPAIAGSASFSSGTFTVQGGGADIWGSSDNFHYAYQSLTGDLTITARVASQQNTNAWAKSGVMIRETAAANSRFVHVFVSPGHGVNMQYRSSTGGSAVQLAQVAGPVAPYWVRLVRSGSTFTGFTSADGVTWTQVGQVSVTMASGALAGLSVTAHNNTALNTSTFDNVAG